MRELLLQPLEAADQKRRSKVALADLWDKRPDGGGHAAERKRGAGDAGAACGEPPAQRAKT